MCDDHQDKDYEFSSAAENDESDEVPTKVMDVVIADSKSMLLKLIMMTKAMVVLQKNACNRI